MGSTFARPLKLTTPAAGLSLSLVLFLALACYPLPVYSAISSPELAYKPEFPLSGKPLPGELIVAFQPVPSGFLKNELGRGASDFARVSTLIGRRLDSAILKEALPELRNVFNYYGVTAADAIDPDNGIYRLLSDPALDVWSFLAAVSVSGQVRFAEPNFPAKAFRDPSDPYYRRGDQWGLARINAPDAWDLTVGSSNITIAVIDSGVAALHPDLEGKVLAGLNFQVSPPTIFTSDDSGHGTFVAGIAAARGDNNFGIAGIAWGSQILPVKVLNSQLSTSNALVAMGINYATERRADVINLSLGSPDRSEAVYQAVRKAYAQGLVLVGAAGNEGNTVPQYPASFDEVISVGASTQNDTPAAFSNSGPEISIVAPGNSIFSLTWAQSNGTLFGFDKGTSFAAPYVSGTVALMLSLNNNLTPRQVRNILEATADFPGITGPLVSPIPIPTNTSPTVTPATPGPINGSSLSTLPQLSTTFNTTATVAPSTSPQVLSTPRSITPVISTPFTVQATGYNPRIGFGRLNTYRAVLAAGRGEIFPSRRGQLAISILGDINPADVVVTVTPGDSRVADEKGNLLFSQLPPGVYSVKAVSSKYGLPSDSFPLPSYTFQITGSGNERQTLEYDFSPVKQLVGSGKPVGAFVSRAKAPIDADSLFFDDTGHSLAKPFRQFWEKNGGLMGLGYPVSEPFVENGKIVQYFQRAVAEIQTDFAGTPFAVQVRRLGINYAELKHKNNPAFTRVTSPEEELLNQKVVYYWKETGHTLTGPFLKHWQEHGGLVTFGLPISEPFTENGRQVQYFERQILELHPELGQKDFEVLGALLGTDIARTEGMLPF